MVSGQTVAQSWSRALSNIAALRGPRIRPLGAVIDAAAAQFPDRPALVAPGEILTYGGLARRKNQYAHWAEAHGIGAGETVCLLMGNRPEYAAIWIGLSQAGAVVALLNTNLAGPALLHAIQAAGAAHVIADADFLPALAGLRGEAACVTCWVVGQAEGVAGVRLLDAGRYPAAPLDGAPSEVAPGQTALLIYTSGTTGLPKAARISHYRVLEWSFWFAGMMGAGPQDRLYDCLPLYHSTGGVALLGAMLVSGGAVEVRRRFSASAFWADVADTGCTIFGYIGELCRYLVNADQAGADQAGADQAGAAPAGQAPPHALRLCVGNGLRADVWRQFTERFAIPAVLEFYASTEGNVSLYNCEGRPGAIGRIPGFLAKTFPVALIECDAESGEALRDAAGLCIRCRPGKQGEAVGLISAAGGPAAFEGYTDAAATRRKILRNVFVHGDAWFRTGDLMLQDAERFFYFVDRLGDSFRWKGENVSSVEVEAALCRATGVTGALVFGVKVAGEEGSAGMAVLTVAGDFCPRALHAELAASLPAYARPVFLRIRARLETTGTFKPVKAALAREGFSQCGGDAVYIADAAAGTYRLLGGAEARLLSEGPRGYTVPPASTVSVMPVMLRA